MPREWCREDADGATAQDAGTHPNRASRPPVLHSTTLAARSNQVRGRFLACSLCWIPSWKPAKRRLRFGCVQARLLPLQFLSARSRPLPFLPCLFLPKHHKTFRLFHERRTVAIIPNDMICTLDFLLE